MDMQIVHDGESWVIDLPPAFLQKDAQEVRGLMHMKIAEGALHFVVDASETGFIDSAAIGVLVQTVIELRARQGDLKIRNLAGEPLAVFKDTGLDQVFGPI
jgi:anti-anti-sigma factor